MHNYNNQLGKQKKRYIEVRECNHEGTMTISHTNAIIRG